MHNYESFKPIDKSVHRSGGTFFKRIFFKANKQETRNSQIESKNSPIAERKASPIVESKRSVKEKRKASPTAETKRSDREINVQPDAQRRQSLNSLKNTSSVSDLTSYETMSFTKILKTVRQNLSTTMTGSSENLPAKHQLNRIYWMPDSICHKCYSCEDEFTAIRRRHHCRICGLVFCYRCCAFELPGQFLNETKPQRSCHRCFQSFYSANNKRRPSNLSVLSVSNQDATSTSQDNRSSHSPTFSERSEGMLPCDQSLESSNRNLSFSSNDVSTNQLYGFIDPQMNKSKDMDDFDTLKRISSVPDLTVANRDSDDTKFERKISPSKLNPRTFIQNHLFRTGSSHKNIQSQTVEPEPSSKVQKQILLLVWKEIIEETNRLRDNYFNKVKIQIQTRSMESQFSFPQEDESTQPDALNVIFTNAVSSQSCIDGGSLVNWMFNRIEEVKDRTHAVAICQSYLEMQLLSPYFPQETSKQFKDDHTMYVIRECSSDYSPRMSNKEYDSNYFTDFEFRGYLSSSSFQKSCGNSTFYVDEDSKKDNSDQQDPEKLQHHNISPFIHIHTGDKPESCNEAYYNKFNASLWNRSCEYLEKLLKQELRDYNLDISWSNIILPVCKLISETISPSISDAKTTNDIRNYIQIKKIPNSEKRDCEFVSCVSLSKNPDFPVGKELKNPSVMLIRSSIDYWRPKKLVSLDPLLLQETEYLKNCVKKILTLKPSIVIVEGNVSLIAKGIMEVSGLVLISNVRKVQMDRLARMLRTTVFDSVDSLGGHVEAQLGHCSQFSVERFRLANNRDKYFLFFKLFNQKEGCTLLLHSNSLSELVRVKYITRFMIVAFRNAHLELSCLKNFQIRFMGNKLLTLPRPTNTGLPDDPTTDTSLEFLDIIENRTIAISSNVYYGPPSNVKRQISNPELQSRLLYLDVLDISWKQRLHDVLKRKQRHIYAEVYDEHRMKTIQHPRIKKPMTHILMNCYNHRQLNDNERCILKSDFRANGSRFHNVNTNIDTTVVSSRNFDSADRVVSGCFLTREQESRWRDQEKKRFELIWESFNPRNYARILMLYSIQTPIGICEKPRKISLSYYEISDKTLGNFVSSMLNDSAVCPVKCESSLFEHVYKFVHNGGCIEVSVHQMESDSHRKFLNTVCSQETAGLSPLKLWNWCSRCDKILSLRDMTAETWNLSLGRFFDLLFNLNSSDVNLAPGQCAHSLQTDIQYYFTQSNNSRALEIKYVPVTVYEYQTPDLMINVNRNNRSDEDLVKSFKMLQKEIENVTEIKTKYNLEIKAKILKLKEESKVEDSELWDFLKQDLNSDQYSKTMENIHNLMEQIFSFHDYFNADLFKMHEHLVNGEIIQLWINLVNFVRLWDQKLNEAYEREEKEKKLMKMETKIIKSSNEDLMLDSENLISKSYNNPNVLQDPVLKDMKEVQLKKLLSCSNDVSQDSVDGKKKFLWNSLEHKNAQTPTIPLLESRNASCNASRPMSRTSTSESLDNIIETEQVGYKKEKTNVARVLDIDTKPAAFIERSSASALTRKFFTTFFPTNNLKVLDEPTPPDFSYVFSDIWSISDPVVVKDDSITSTISFALSSNMYQEKLHEMNQYMACKPSVKSDTLTMPGLVHDLKVSDIGQVDGYNNPNVFVGDTTGISKDRLGSATIDSIKDREPCVRYVNRAEDEEVDIDLTDLANNDTKIENEEIKIEISNEEIVAPDDGMPQRSFLIPKVPTPVPKKVPKSDFELSFNNHKAKCFCRIYNGLQFHQLREAIMGSDQQSYIRSLSECKHWVTTGGKSGLKFRKTMDDRYIIKQLHPMELSGFKKFHEKYFEYVMDRVKQKQKCVLAKILGIYHVDYNNSVTKVSEKLDFLVMENLFYNQKPSKIFDLKGNRQIAVNVPAEKISASDTSVMQDKEFISYSRGKPIYVSWQTQIALKETLTRDTDFLKSLPVMDYSLLVGVDDNNQILVIGIIDYLRMFTIDKLIEMHFKQKLLTPHGESPTVIQPERYQKRFLEAIDEYFLICPMPWDCLLLYPSIPNNISTSANNNQSQSNSEFGTPTQKPKDKFPRMMRSFEKKIDENRLRFGRFESA